MSYELHFAHRPDQSPPSWHELVEWAQDRPGFDVLDDGQTRRLIYEGPLTGASASFWWGEASEAPDPGEGYALSGVRFSLASCRASFFAVECVPLASELAMAFKLRGVDAEDGEAGAQPVNTQVMIARWRRINAQAIEAQAAAGAAPPRMSTVDALAWWSYRWQMPALQGHRDPERAPEGFFVPQLLVFGDAQGRALRVAQLPRPRPALLPPCDVFALRREASTVLVRAETVFEALGPLIEVSEQDEALPPCISERSLQGEGAVDRWATFYNAVEGELDPATLLHLHPDEFVDGWPSERPAEA